MTRILLLSIFAIGILFNSNANQWSQKSDFGSFGRHRGVAVGIGNKVYAGTGHLNGTGFDTWYSDWWEYDPANNTWAQKADYIGNGGTGDQDLTAIAINGIGYIGGGWYGGAAHYKYDPSINNWTQLATPPITVANTDPFVINGKGYYTDWGTDWLYMYDPAVDLWTPVSQMPTFASQRDPTFVIDDKGYFKRETDFFEFDPSTNTWTQKASFPGAGQLYNLGLEQYGYGFIIGGLTNGLADMYQEVWRYDPNTDTWTQMEDYPFSARRWAVKAKVGERCYVGLGTNGTNFNDFWSFDMLAGQDEIEFEKITCFPNPTSNKINISWQSSGIVKVEIIGFDGMLMKNEKVNQNSYKIDCSFWPKGNYIIKLTSENGYSISESITVQ